MTGWYKVLPQSFCMQLRLVILLLREDDCLRDVKCLSTAPSHLHTSRVCTGDCLSHSSLTPCLLFCLSFSLALCLVVSSNLSREMYCFRLYKRLCIILSIAFLLSLPLFLLLGGYHFLVHDNNWYHADKWTLKDNLNLIQLQLFFLHHFGLNVGNNNILFNLKT